MKYKVYTRVDIIERKAGPLVIARSDEGAERYYKEQDEFMVKNYNIRVNPQDVKILCLGEYDTEIDIIENEGQVYPPMLLTSYNQSEVYYIDNVKAGYKPKSFEDSELQGDKHE